MLTGGMRNARATEYFPPCTDTLAPSISPDPLPSLVSAGELLRSIFGPDKWATRAAKSLGCKPQHVWKVARGTRTMPRRWRAKLLAIVEFRGMDLERECRLRKAELDKVYAEQRGKLERARGVLERMERMERARRKQ